MITRIFFSSHSRSEQFWLNKTPWLFPTIFPCLASKIFDFENYIFVSFEKIVHISSLQFLDVILNFRSLWIRYGQKGLSDSAHSLIMTRASSNCSISFYEWALAPYLTSASRRSTNVRGTGVVLNLVGKHVNIIKTGASKTHKSYDQTIKTRFVRYFTKNIRMFWWKLKKWQMFF